jgi:hypothetical protein
MNDNIIYWTKIIDSESRIKRHELSDFVIRGLKRSDYLYLPYIPYAFDSIQLETSVIDLSAAGEVIGKNAENKFKRVKYQDLLSYISSNTQLSSISLIYDKSAISKNEERSAALATLKKCYPKMEILSGKFFDLITLSNLQEPLCYSIFPPEPISPDPLKPIDLTTPIVLEWKSSTPNLDQYQISIEQQNDASIWIEAEVMDNQAGWIQDTLYAEGYSGNGYLTDLSMTFEARTGFQIPESGIYQLWVRTYKRFNNSNFQYFITIDEAPARIYGSGGEDTLNKWQWENLGSSKLDIGLHQITISKTNNKDPHSQIFLDVMVFSPDTSFYPNTSVEWKPVYQSELFPTLGKSTVTLNRNLSLGKYRWNVRLFNGLVLVDWLGDYGVVSPYSEFIIIK